jgi:hypothetical protein
MICISSQLPIVIPGGDLAHVEHAICVVRNTIAMVESLRGLDNKLHLRDAPVELPDVRVCRHMKMTEKVPDPILWNPSKPGRAAASA